MLTIIESESRAWMVIATDGDLRIYSRENSGEWTELSLENSDQVDRDKGLMMEELYSQLAGQEEDYEESEEPDAEEEQAEEEDEDSNEDEENEPEEEPEQPRRRRATANTGRGRSS